MDPVLKEQFADRLAAREEGRVQMREEQAKQIEQRLGDRLVYENNLIQQIDQIDRQIKEFEKQREGIEREKVLTRGSIFELQEQLLALRPAASPEPPPENRQQRRGLNRRQRKQQQKDVPQKAELVDLSSALA